MKVNVYSTLVRDRRGKSLQAFRSDEERFDFIFDYYVKEDWLDLDRYPPIGCELFEEDGKTISFERAKEKYSNSQILDYFFDKNEDAWYESGDFIIENPEVISE